VKSLEIKPLTMMLNFISIYSNFTIDINCDLNSRACKTLKKYSCETQPKALDWSREIIAAEIILVLASTRFLIRWTLLE